MALRSLLRRVALLPPSGPRMGPVRGISPASAARFMKTGSQGEAKTVAEQASIRGGQHFINEPDKEFAQLEEIARQRLAEFSSAVDTYKKVGTASTVVIAAIPLVMIFGSKYVV